MFKSCSIIGWREWVALPKLHIPHIKAKIDTGAKTSALHAIDVKRLRHHGNDRVQFIVHPIQRNERKEVICRANLVDMRTITDSGGNKELRYVIETVLVLGHESFMIELTLTNRASMGFRMLLGRSALQKRFLINPTASFLTREMSE